MPGWSQGVKPNTPSRFMVLAVDYEPVLSVSRLEDGSRVVLLESHRADRLRRGADHVPPRGGRRPSRGSTTARDEADAHGWRADRKRRRHHSGMDGRLYDAGARIYFGHAAA